MQNDEFSFPQAIYLKHLTIMNGINFTRREMDVMACLLHGRGTSKIASLLDIAPTTVITHIQKVMDKLKCNSREAIIDFVEKSHDLVHLKMYYSSLVVYAAFEKSLKNCSKLTNDPLSPLILYYKNRRCGSVLERHLQNHLKLAGIEAEISLQEVYNQKNAIENKINIFILDKEASTNVKELKGVASINLRNQTNYYLIVFEILQKLHPKANFNQIIAEFKKFYEQMEESNAPSDFLTPNNINLNKKEIHFFKDKRSKEEKYMQIRLDVFFALKKSRCIL